MSNCGCGPRINCTTAALITSVVVGVVTAFLQILGVITVGTAFLWVTLGIAVVYLAGLVVASALSRRTGRPACTCRVLNTLLAGILGTVLLSLVLLAVGIEATSVISAIGVGLLLFFLALIVTASACYVRCEADCG